MRILLGATSCKDMHQYEKVKPFSRMKTILGGVTVGTLHVACTISSARQRRMSFFASLSLSLSPPLSSFPPYIARTQVGSQAGGLTGRPAGRPASRQACRQAGRPAGKNACTNACMCNSSLEIHSSMCPSMHLAISCWKRATDS